MREGIREVVGYRYALHSNTRCRNVTPLFTNDDVSDRDFFCVPWEKSGCSDVICMTGWIRIRSTYDIRFFDGYTYCHAG